MSTDPRDQRDPAQAEAPIESAPATDAEPAPDASREQAPVSATRRRAEEQRQAKQDLVREQVESGSLVIRQMTAEERERYPPRAERPDQRRGRGR
jgi:hypothetical protein